MEGAIRFFALVVAAALPLALPVRAAELPKRQPGVWETRAVIGAQYKVLRRCYRPGEQAVYFEAVGMDACKRQAMKTIAGYLMQVDCKYQGLNLSGRMQVTGDFTSQLTGRVRTTVQPQDASAPPKRAAMTFTSRRLSECKPAG